MRDGTDAFTARFQVPKATIKKIQREYKDSKEALQKLNPEELKNFKEMGEYIFAFFEELTEKKVNRDVMLGNVSYYFDEGFDVESMRLYIRKEMDREYFAQNPDKFTISNIFPIRDQDRINLAWDGLAHCQKVAHQKTPDSKDKSPRIRLTCKHVVTVFELREADGVCIECPPPPPITDELKHWVQNIVANQSK